MQAADLVLRVRLNVPGVPLEAMLIAFLALLGVDLIVLVTVAALLLGRRRWLKRQPGAFAGAIRVGSGDVNGLGSKWKRGYGRWVSDVLVWAKAPLLFRNELIPVDRLAMERSPGEVKRLGDEPVVIELESDDARIEVSARAEHRDLVIGSLKATAAPQSS